MSTNYYWHASGKSECECCGQAMPSLHIGKSSGNWMFSLRVYEDIRSLDDWIERWKTGGIFDEYGTPITPEAMLSVIVDRPLDAKRHPWNKDYPCVPGGPTYDLCNYEFS